MNRRKIIKTAALAGAVAGLSACKNKTSATNCESSADKVKTINWKMVTTWPKNFPGLGTGAEFLANKINQMSGGRLVVKVYGANELVPAFEVFDAVSSGTAQMGHGAAYYWKGKVPEAQFFGAVPFGMNANEMNAWLYHGGGLELWQETYKPFGLKPLPAGQTGVQMGGWFNKEVNTTEDIKGLVMRIPGLAGEVLSRAGGTPQVLPGAELFTALQTGTIDATEWVGPYNDLAFGLYQAAQFYYYPGWHEPTACLEAIINQQAFDALPEDLQAVWDRLRRKLSQIQGLPSGVQPNLNDDGIGEVFGIAVGLVMDGFSYAETKDYIDDIKDDIIKLELAFLLALILLRRAMDDCSPNLGRGLTWAVL